VYKFKLARQYLEIALLSRDHGSCSEEFWSKPTTWNKQALTKYQSPSGWLGSHSEPLFGLSVRFADLGARQMPRDVASSQLFYVTLLSMQ
jgi:hypothetical protein